MALGSSVQEGYVGVSLLVFFESVFENTLCTAAGDAVQVVMHCRLRCTTGYDALKKVMHRS